MKELMRRHLVYPKSSKRPKLGVEYNNFCQCTIPNLYRRTPRKCYLVSLANKLLECNVCGDIFMASSDEMDIFKRYYRKQTYRLYGNRYTIVDKSKYRRLTE